MENNQNNSIKEPASDHMDWMVAETENTPSSPPPPPPLIQHIGMTLADSDDDDDIAPLIDSSDDEDGFPPPNAPINTKSVLIGAVSSQPEATTAPTPATPTLNPKFKLPPYHAPVLSGYSRDGCSVCKLPLRARVARDQCFPWFCDRCAQVFCGHTECDPMTVESVQKRHDYFCASLGFETGRDLVQRLMAPAPPPEDDKRPLDCLSLANSLWTVAQRGVLGYAEGDNQSKGRMEQNVVHHLRQHGQEGTNKPGGLEQLMMEPLMQNAEELESQIRDEKIPWQPTRQADLAELQRLRLTLTAMGDSYMDRLFGAHILAASLHRDTYAQLYHFYERLFDTRMLMLQAVAGNLDAKPGEKVPAFSARDLAAITNPYHILSFEVNVEKGRYASESYVIPPNQKHINAMSHWLERDLAKGFTPDQPLNVIWYIELVHLNAREARDILTPRDKIDPNASKRRPASTQLVVRLMGDPTDPQVFVMQMHSTLYSLEQWLSGILISENAQMQTRVQGADTAAAFNAMDHRDPLLKNVVDKDAFFQTMRCKYLVENPPLAREKVQGMGEAVRLFQALDALCNPNVDRKARLEAYELVTGIKWPNANPLNAFGCIATRGDLVA